MASVVCAWLCVGKGWAWRRQQLGQKSVWRPIRRIYIGKSVRSCQNILATCLYVPQFRPPRYTVVKRGTKIVANTLFLTFSEFLGRNRPSVRTTDSSSGVGPATHNKKYHNGANDNGSKGELPSRAEVTWFFQLLWLGSRRMNHSW